MRIKLRSRLETKLTGVNPDYIGSISLAPQVMKGYDIEPYEQVHVLNKTNGERLITYAVEGRPGECCLNGAAARLGQVGDEVIILTYEIVEPQVSWGVPTYIPDGVSSLRW